MCDATKEEYSHGFDEVRAAIKLLLDNAGVAYSELTHEPTRTVEESARARNEPVEIGGKALCVRVDGQFRVFVLSAHLRLDSSAIRKHFRTKNTRFASLEELNGLSGLVPGCIPPFGAPFFRGQCTWIPPSAHSPRSLSTRGRLSIRSFWLRPTT